MELLGKSREELAGLLQALGEPAYRSEQIYHALYAERNFDVRGDDDFADGAAGKIERRRRRSRCRK